VVSFINLLLICEYSTTQNHDLKLYCTTHNLQYQTPEGSLISPADASGTTAVGCIDQANWSSGPQEPYSSRGPTSDNRKKPEIMGPDSVSTYTYTPFNGTSSATAHLTGAAALLLEENPSLTVSQLEEKLLQESIDMGTAGQDNIYGYGRVHLIYNIAWKFPASGKLNGVTASPAAYFGVVYIGSNDGYFYAVQGNTGQQKWQYSVGSGFSITTSPWVYRDGGKNMIIFIATQNATSTSRVYKIRDDGSSPYDDFPNWPVQLSVEARGEPVTDITCSQVFVGCENGTIQVISLSTGTVSTISPSGASAFRTRAAYYLDNYLYLADNAGLVYVIEPSTGTVLRSFDIGTSPAGGVSMRFRDGGEPISSASVYIGDTGSNGLYALNVTSFTTPRGNYSGGGTVSIGGRVWSTVSPHGGDRIYFTSSNNSNLYSVTDNGAATDCLSLTSGYPYSINSTSTSAVLIIQRIAFFDTGTAHGYGVDISGTPGNRHGWPKLFGETLTGSPSYDWQNKMVIFATQDGRIYGFKVE
jgi:outer membrane protein assembly factor BamB